MFAFQNLSTTKRRREDDSDSDDGAHEHQLKRSRPWVRGFQHGQPQMGCMSNTLQRPSPTPPRTISDLEALTPAQSDHGDSPEPHFGSPVHISRADSSDDDMDMDDDNEDVTSQPPESPFTNTFMRPAMLNASLFAAEPVNASGRMPTPIHPTFKRGGMHGIGFPSGGAAGGLHNKKLGLPAPILQTPMSRKSNKQEVDHDRSRRMPSPISEDEDIPDTPTAFTQSQLARLSVSQGDRMDLEQPPIALGAPPSSRGRKRSGAFTGKGRFSMGYRDDCEKCQQRAPGHYSHFLTMKE